MVALIIGIVLSFVGIFIDFYTTSEIGFKIGTAMILVGAVVWIGGLVLYY